MDPPCNLPEELWKQEILQHLRVHCYTPVGVFCFEPEGFLYVRSLRLTCKWFAHHCVMEMGYNSNKTHTAFWPAVEAFIKLGYRDFLFKLDFPTHRGCCIQRGYDGHANWSFGRAGLRAAKDGDADLVRLLMIHGQEWWTHWLATAIKHQHRAVITLLLDEIDSGMHYRGIDQDYIFPHVPLLDAAIKAHDFETLKVLTRHIQVKREHFELSVECKCPSIIQWYLRARFQPKLRFDGIRHSTVVWKPAWFDSDE
jgi:hypothetical protein